MLGDSPSREMDKVELSAGTGLRRNRPLADAWGYLAAQGDRMSNGVFDRAPHSDKPQTEAIGRIPWLSHSPKRQRGDGFLAQPSPR